MTEVQNSSNRSLVRSTLLSLGGTNIKLEDIGQIVIPNGQAYTEATILERIAAIQNNLKFDDQLRAMVEIWDENTKTARLVYVQKQGESISLLPLPQEELRPQIDRAHLLMNLKSLLKLSQK